MFVNTKQWVFFTFFGPCLNDILRSSSEFRYSNYNLLNVPRRGKPFHRFSARHLATSLVQLNKIAIKLRIRFQDHEAVCSYVQVPCVHSKCGELVTRSNLVEHLEHSCKFRTEKCEYCHALVEVAFMEVHVKVISLFVCCCCCCCCCSRYILSPIF